MTNEENKKEQEVSTNFHQSKPGEPHDTYRNQERYVASLNNQWAMENFNATRPYFA